MSGTWSLKRGATIVPGEGVRFCVWAPNAERVAVVIEGTERSKHDLTRGECGVYEEMVAGIGPGTKYRFALSEQAEFADPVSRWQADGVHGPSVVVDPNAFAWSDGQWAGLDLADYVIYELHVGTATPQGTFEALVSGLERLRELGVTAIELMPVAQFPGDRNWGYDGVFLFAPQNTYGGPKGLRRLVDRAHTLGLAVVMDVVYNHLGPEGNVLHQYGPYFTDRYRTPWGAAVNFDGPDSDEVRRYFIDNALYWVREFHIDALRLDAVHAIYDFGAIHILEELADKVHELGSSLGRKVHVIAESDLNDARVVRGEGQGGYALDGQWNDDFHHAVHAALTGERRGYYVDFGGISPIGKAIADRFVIDGQHSAFRRRRHGAPAADVPPDRFVGFVQNHDQVGNRAEGERLSALVDFDQQKLAAFLLLLSPYVPLIFMGEEYGERNPFLYFVSHTDDGLIEAVRRGRRAEFEAFAWKGEVPDPQSRRTFERSMLTPETGWDDEQHAMLRLYRDLLDLRRRHPALRPGDAEVRVTLGDDQAWLAWELLGPANSGVLAVAHFGAEPGEIDLGTSGRPGAALLSTAAAEYGGSGAPRESLRAASRVNTVRVAASRPMGTVYDMEVA